MALGAFLTDREALTTAKVRARIAAGAPIYGKSPDRPTGPQRREPFTSEALPTQVRARLSPEAYGALFSAVPAALMLPRDTIGRAMAQSGAAPREHQDTGAVYTQAQIMLAAWGKAGGPVDPSDFGQTSADLTGTDDPRTRRAISSFQRWANTQGANLRDDGVLNDETLGQLIIVTADVLQKPAVKSRFSGWLGWGAAAVVVAALAYSEYGGGRSK